MLAVLQVIGQFLVVGLLCMLLWRFALKPKTPKRFVWNLGGWGGGLFPYCSQPPDGVYDYLALVLH